MAYEEPKITTPSDLGTALEHAQRLTVPLMPPEDRVGNPITLVPKGWEAHEIKWPLAVPDRIRAKIIFQDLPSFIAYFKKFQQPGTMLLGEMGDNLRFTSIFDYHAPEYPDACTHSAHYVPALSVAWKRWTGVDKVGMTQTIFAQFLEDNVSDLVEPAGADLLQIINEFEVDGTLTFQRVQRLSNGSVKFAFQNDQKAKAGELSVPEIFTLALPIWEGTPPERVIARLRYRLSATGELKLWFELVNIHHVLRAASQNFCAKVGEQAGLKVLLGTVG